jgi:hypothetical protein
MKKLITLLLLFTITLFYSIATQAFDIPLNYGVSDNDEAFVQTKNLFDKTDTTTGSRINSSTGGLVSDGIKSYSNYIEILPNTQYAQSYNSVLFGDHYAFYTDTFVYISGGIFTTFTTPSNAKYIRLTVITVDDGFGRSLSTYQFERGSTATSYAPYGFLSLNDIFLDGNETPTTIIETQLTATYYDNYIDVLTNLNNVNHALIFRYNDLYPLLSTDKLYVNVRPYKAFDESKVPVYLETNAPYHQLGFGSFTLANTNSFIYQRTSNMTSLSFISLTFLLTEENFEFSILRPHLIMLNTLGIDHLNIYELDALFNDWETNNIYDQGFTDGELSSEAYANGFTSGYELGYGDGYTDAVEEDNAYALGFAKGLLEGTDMETGSSLLILIVALIGFVMMIFGFTTKRGIFNLLSVGAFVVLGGLLVQFVGFVIIAIGLVLINIYYAFFGDL